MSNRGRPTPKARPKMPPKRQVGSHAGKPKLDKRWGTIWLTKHTPRKRSGQ